LIREGLALYHRHQHDRGVAWVLIHLSWLCIDIARRKAACRFLRDALARCERLGDRQGIARCQNLQGYLVWAEAWKKRPLRGRYVYLYADGLYLKAGAEQDKTALLVVLGVDEQGRKELLAMESGYRESGDDHDRYRCTTRDRATAIGEFPSVQSRKQQVQDDDVRPDLAYVLECFGAILRGYDLVPAVSKVVSNHPLDPRVIVDNKDAGQRGTSRLGLTGRAPQ
jgi:hypothetical protein